MKNISIRTMGITVALLVVSMPAGARAGQLEPGVVVEDVGEGSALARAGLEAGDLLLSWQRLPNPPANPEGASGTLASPFDWMWLGVEQAPRGTVELRGRRGGEERGFTVTPGLWDARVRPRMPETLLAEYLRGRERLAAGETAQAANLWEKLAAAAANWRLRCWLRLRLGEIWFEARDWETARAAYRSALDEAREPLPRALIWRAIGKGHERQSEFEPARQAYDAAQDIRGDTWGPVSLAVAESLNDLGDMALTRSDVKRAAALFQRALELRQKLAPGSLGVAESLNNVGVVATDLGDFERAAHLLQSALEITQKLAPDSLYEALCLSNLGRLAGNTSDLPRADGFLRRALEIKRRLRPDSATFVITLVNLGNVARARGDLDRATDFYRRALEICQRLRPGSLEMALSVSNLGAVAQARGDLDRATDLFQRALKIRARLAPGGINTAYSLRNLGEVARMRGDLEQAMDLQQSALEMMQKQAPDSVHVSIILDNLGVVATLRGDLQQAKAYHQRALEMAQEMAPGGADVAWSLYDLGVVATEQGDLDQAAEFHQRALAILQQLTPNGPKTAETLHALGLLYRRKEPPQPAVADDYLRRALHTVETHIGLGGSHDVRSGFRAQYDDYYRDALEVQLELGQPEAAFHTLERSRARSFLERLAERDTVLTADIPEALDRQRRHLAARFDRTQQRLAKLNPRDHAAEIEDLREQLRQLRDEAGDVEEKIRRTSPRLAALRYPQPLDLEAARAILDPGTLLLSYSVGEASTYLFAVTGDGPLEVHSLPIAEVDLSAAVRELRELIPRARPGDETGASRSLRAMGRRLYRELIQPAADGVTRSERILIVPDGPLHLLPWSTLIRERGEDEDQQGRGWQYLAEWRPLHLALSATVYGQLRQERGKHDAPGTLLAAFGDPLYPSTPPASDDRSVDVYVRAAAERGFDFSPLPYTRREVEQISVLYPPPAARTYLGAEATEERVKALGREPRILHFATHGHLDDRFPLSSALVLTIPEELGEGRDNGLLQVWEIFEQVRFDADLVVLSACRSALGQERGGEGLIGLTRALQYAGARSVVASLWSVEDQTTAELMVRFYRHLRAGRSKDEALRAAQIELIRGPIQLTDEQGRTVEKDRSAPYYWAAFQIYGDWQ